MSQFGLIGKSLSHSFSKKYFEDFFQKNSLTHSYSNLEFANESLLGEFFNDAIFQYKGLNVTIPYKETVNAFLSELTDEAKAIGSVNTIKISNGNLIGHNTDAFGFHQSIKPFLTNQHDKALILGTGGASKAVAYIFKKIGIDVLYISQSKKGNLIFPYDAINEHMLRACKCIVNTTPVGMFPNIIEQIPIPFEHLTSEHLIVDLIYNPEETLFLQEAKKRGASTLNGLTMLKEQAMEAWRFWNND